MVEDRALDNLGPHLLGRLPNEPDDRDYAPADLEVVRRVVAGLTTETTLKQLRDLMAGDEGDGQNTYHEWTITWKPFHALFSAPSPTPPPSPAPTGAPWVAGPILDQGQTGTCVGNGWAGWGNATPVVDAYTETDARKIYYEATCLDGKCDPTYQNGSTTRSGVKAMQNRGKVLSYAFTTGSGAAQLGQLRDWLAKSGPAVCGVDWYNDSFTPDANGFISLTGGIAGGHEFLLLNDRPDLGAIEAVNSWGDGWAKAGHFFIRYTDVSTLFSTGGDCCLALEK